MDLHSFQNWVIHSFEELLHFGATCFILNLKIRGIYDCNRDYDHGNTGEEKDEDNEDHDGGNDVDVNDDYDEGKYK